MSDRRLRQLEREWLESGTKVARKRYDLARARAGLPRLPREVIRHYVDEKFHGHVGSDGELDIDLRLVDQLHVFSACGNELWPRNLRPLNQRFGDTFRKVIYYTEDSTDVTCKLCLRSMAKVDRGGKSVRTHYAPGSKCPPKGDLARERVVRPICGRHDSDKFVETFSWTMREVNCPACKRVMRPGNRRPRKPTAR